MPEGVTVDTSTFEQAMTQFIALKKVSLREGLRLQAGLLADELVRDTPPEAGVVNGRARSARLAGAERVARDVRRAVRPLDPKQWQSDKIADLIRAKRYDTLQLVFDRINGDQIVPFDEQLHEGARDREGRVRKRLPRATPDWKEEAIYTKRMRRHVGLAKGGWVAAQEALGRKTQAWLRPHAWVGALTDRTDEAEPRVVIENRSRWAGGRLADIVVRKALTRREGRMRRWIEGALAANARKAGLS